MKVIIFRRKRSGSGSTRGSECLCLWNMSEMKWDRELSEWKRSDQKSKIRSIMMSKRWSKRVTILESVDVEWRRRCWLLEKEDQCWEVHHVGRSRSLMTRTKWAKIMILILYCYWLARLTHFFTTGIRYYSSCSSSSSN